MCRGAALDEAYAFNISLCLSALSSDGCIFIPRNSANNGPSYCS